MTTKKFAQNPVDPPAKTRKPRKATPPDSASQSKKQRQPAPPVLAAFLAPSTRPLTPKQLAKLEQIKNQLSTRPLTPEAADMLIEWRCAEGNVFPDEDVSKKKKGRIHRALRALLCEQDTPVYNETAAIHGTIDAELNKIEELAEQLFHWRMRRSAFDDTPNPELVIITKGASHGLNDYIHLVHWGWLDHYLRAILVRLAVQTGLGSGPEPAAEPKKRYRDHL